uniref:hypothetical protein n=1 Tax=Variovorax sp. BK018 TaxID=3450241 RepID=UPI00403A5383
MGLWTLSAAAIALVAGWPKVVPWANANSGLASWVQGIFSVLAVLASAGLVHWQHRLELKRADMEASKTSRRAETDTLLMLQYIAAQLKRTNVVANFQLDAVGNPVIYSDIPGEFRALSETLDKLPFSQLTLHGQLDTYLCLRRAADELVQLYAVAPQQGDRFYMKNRGRLEALRKQCSEFQLSLAEAIHGKDPDLYKERQEDMLRL